MAPTPRLRCGSCGKSRPEHDTTLVKGSRSGNYRRAMASVMRRVCRECTQGQVDFVRKCQAERRQAPLNDSYFNWADAADYFGIDRTGLYRTDYEKRQMEASA